jgi:hypothetical protein
MEAQIRSSKKKMMIIESLTAGWNLRSRKSKLRFAKFGTMKSLFIIFFVVAATLAQAQDEAQYKLNPDSLRIPRKRVVDLKINGPLFILDDKEISSEEVQTWTRTRSNQYKC